MTADQAELRDGNAAGFRAKGPIDAAIAETGMRGIIVQGIIASNRRVLGIDQEHSGNGQSGSNGGTNGHAERAQTTSPEAPYHGVQVPDAPRHPSGFRNYQVPLSRR